MRALPVRPGSGDPRVQDVPAPGQPPERDVEVLVQLQPRAGGSAS